MVGLGGVGWGLARIRLGLLWVTLGWNNSRSRGLVCGLSVEFRLLQRGHGIVIH